ncbi:MAG: hypothetical protein CYG60_17870 [Actinobacteria bacterium]|nr:MAG: hypothetical protein CYG60_17870 [Actinomycetota bacterium]
MIDEATNTEKVEAELDAFIERRAKGSGKAVAEELRKGLDVSPDQQRRDFSALWREGVRRRYVRPDEDGDGDDAA